MICEAEAVLSKKTTLRRFAAAIRMDKGVVTITAPKVPPRTIIAAVYCARSARRPPSRTRPPRIPPRATTRPAILARSGFVPDAFAFAPGVFGLLHDLSGSYAQPLALAVAVQLAGAAVVLYGRRHARTK